MKKLILVSLILGVIILAVLGIMLVLDIVAGPEARIIAIKTLSVVGIITSALLVVYLIAKKSN